MTLKINAAFDHKIKNIFKLKYIWQSAVDNYNFIFRYKKNHLPLQLTYVHIYALPDNIVIIIIYIQVLYIFFTDMIFFLEFLFFFFLRPGAI